MPIWKHMAEQIRKAKQHTGTRKEESEEVTAETHQSDEIKEETDALLDEIDDLLEENAEDFVKQYVQKGGQ